MLRTPFGYPGWLPRRTHLSADGEYLFSISGLAAGGYGGMEYRNKVVMTIDGVKVFEKEVGGEEDQKYVDQKQAPAVADVRQRLKDPYSSEGRPPQSRSCLCRARHGRVGQHPPVIRSRDRSRPHGAYRGLQVAGPYNATGIGDTPTRQKIFICHPPDKSEEPSCANRIFSNIARQAYRSPVTDRDLAAPMAFFKQARETGTFESGIQNGLMAILASPKFLYRTETVPANLKPGAIYRISDLELASRLSFFLWSENPDDELINLAADGKLSDPAVLQHQVKRMLADPRSKSARQQFRLRVAQPQRHRRNQPGPGPVPGFRPQPANRLHHRTGTVYPQHHHRGPHCGADLLSGNYTFVNERLALHYGIPNIRGSEFRRVTLTDPNRWGLLGKGGVLMVTAYPNRTSPVLRGSWILERILGTPPTAPPPNVPAFPETKEGAKVLTVRERMEEHRKIPSCNACHGIMDPLGFSLENFDAVGEWRTMDRWARTPIDSSGKLVDGTPVNGPADLRKALTKDPHQFVETMTEKLMMYGLSRELEPKDMPLVRKIVTTTAPDQYRFSSLVMAIVNSAPFQMKKVETQSGEPKNVHH